MNESLTADYVDTLRALLARVEQLEAEQATEQAAKPAATAKPATPEPPETKASEPPVVPPPVVSTVKPLAAPTELVGPRCLRNYRPEVDWEYEQRICSEPEDHDEEFKWAMRMMGRG